MLQKMVQVWLTNPTDRSNLVLSENLLKPCRVETLSLTGLHVYPSETPTWAGRVPGKQTAVTLSEGLNLREFQLRCFAEEVS